MATGIVLVLDGNVTRPLFCTNTVSKADRILTVDDAADSYTGRTVGCTASVFFTWTEVKTAVI